MGGECRAKHGEDWPETERRLKWTGQNKAGDDYRMESLYEMPRKQNRAGVCSHLTCCGLEDTNDVTPDGSEENNISPLVRVDHDASKIIHECCHEYCD
jgi:hypothetical protein